MCKVGVNHTDLSPLAGLTKLQELAVLYAPVTDLSPLATTPNLTRLTLSHTQVSDLTPSSKCDESGPELRLDDTASQRSLTVSECDESARVGPGQRPKSSELRTVGNLADLTELRLSSNPGERSIHHRHI